MNPRVLKPLRLCFALAFFMGTALIFLDIWDTGVRLLADKLLVLQFVPSLLKFMNHAALGAAGFMVVLGLTLIFGRIYCSAICPLGIFQDVISRVFSKKRAPAGKKTKSPAFKYSPPRNILRYGIFLATLLFFAAGTALMLNLLDPFSSFGRMMTHLFHPVVIFLNNLSVSLAETLGNHALFRVRLPAAAPLSLGIALASVMLIGWMSVRHGRLYCNTLCPVGTLLGLVSKFSIVRVGIHSGACRSCGACRRVCKAGCIDVKTKQVDVSRCVTCFNCLSACPDQAMVYRSRFRKNLPRPSHKKTAQNRRNFMLTLAAGSLGIAAGGVNATPNSPPIQARPTTIAENKTCPLSPPGSRGIKRYTSICTACHLCVSACPSGLLTPSVSAFGLSNMMQPRMNFNRGHCNFDCTVCSNICPSGAILPLTIAQKQQTQVGVAKFIKENCVVYTDNTNCGACSEHCPTKAVTMVPYINAAGRNLVIPKMNEAICVGCGGCEHACPTRPYKAIYVDGNLMHRTAEKPQEKKLEQETSQDFPF
jgi:ferredoxin